MYDWLVTLKEAAPGAGLLIATCSVVIAFSVFAYTRAANRRRATLDMIMKMLMDESVQRRQAEYKGLILRDQDPNDCFKIESLAEPSMKGTKERIALLFQLNIYETMALGIRRGVFDEQFYKQWFHNQFLVDYKATEPFIRKMQEGIKKSIYCESDALYHRWLHNGVPGHSPGRSKMIFYSLTGQYGKIGEVLEQTRAR